MGYLERAHFSDLGGVVYPNPWWHQSGTAQVHNTGSTRMHLGRNPLHSTAFWTDCELSEQIPAGEGPGVPQKYCTTVVTLLRMHRCTCINTACPCVFNIRLKYKKVFSKFQNKQETVCAVLEDSLTLAIQLNDGSRLSDA